MTERDDPRPTVSGSDRATRIDHDDYDDHP
jgi:hypothetical protein